MFSWIREWVGGGKGSEAYCFVCKRKRTIVRPRTVILQNGRETRQGSCAHCGTDVSAISGQRSRKS